MKFQMQSDLLPASNIINYGNVLKSWKSIIITFENQNKYYSAIEIFGF